MLAADILRGSLLILFLGIFQGSAVSINQLSRERVRRIKTVEILKYMNTSVDPCDDFYEFTCANYGTYHPASFERPTTGTFESLIREFESKIKLILTTEDAKDTNADRKVKSLYKSCMQLPSLSKPEKLTELIKEFGQMPALVGDNWLEYDFDWVQLVGEIAYKYGIQILLSIDVNVDLANQQVNSIYVTHPEFNAPRAIYLDKNHEKTLEKKRMLYGLYLKTYMNFENTVAEQLGQQFVDLEISLAKGLYDKQSGVSVNDITVRDNMDNFQQQYSADLDLRKLLRIALGSLPKLNVTIEKPYIENLFDVLKKTPKRTVANYIFFKLITTFIYLPETPMNMEEVCDVNMKKFLFENLANMVYRKYVTEESADAIQHMWLDIKTAFQNVLESQKLNWIHRDARKYAVKKLQAMTLNIISYEEKNFEQEFSQLDLSVDKDYISNLKVILSANALESRAINYAVPQPFQGNGQSLNSAVYYKMENSIKIPVTLLQPFYTWDASYPNAYNFGQLGFLLSHELLHGFDDSGRSYDAQGQTEHEWWQEDPENGFNKRSQCFMEQYQQYMYGDQHLPAMANQDENIADNGGVRLAYKAYLQWYANALTTRSACVKDMESLQGLNYNHKQLFFLSYGHLWCSHVLPEFKVVQLTVDNHTPKPFRAMGPLANMEEFSREFNCPQGSFMNPLKKCEIY